jgi:hypothetical protein
MKYIGNEPTLNLVTTNGPFDYTNPGFPTVTTNPSIDYATWLNTTTGETFVCTDRTANANVWIGQLGSVIQLNVLDFFGDSSCILWYALNGDATDESGNYDGTENNTPTYSSPSPDGTQFFEGTGGSGGKSITRTLTATADGAVSVWVKADTLRLANYDVFFLWDDNGGTPTRRIRIFDFGGTVAEGNSTQFNMHFQNDLEQKTVIPALTLGEWTHLLVSWEEGAFLKFYRNGEMLFAQDYLGTAGAMNVDDIIIGAAPAHYGGGANLEIDGGVENVRIFNRGLTHAEALELYNARA